MSAQPDHNDLLAAARLWYDAGYCVVPTHEDGGKRPFGLWKEYQGQRPTWEQLVAWMDSGLYDGIGVICGAVSGNAEMIELEGPLPMAIERLQRVITKAGEYDEINLTELLSRVARGCIEQSAGGGLHLFIRVIDGPAKGNTKLAMQGQGKDRKVVSETRGEGGFVVVAPTSGRKGHAEGTSYLFINGGTPDKTVEVTAEERDMLQLAFSLALDEDDEVEVKRELERTQRLAAPPSVYDGVSVFDDYRARVTWREILEPAGWTYHSKDAEREYWTRPGKDRREGHSASTVEDGPFYCFTTSTSFPSELALTKPQVYAHLHHGGDASEAARALMAAGYGSAPTSRELTPWEAQLDPGASEEEKAEAQSNWVTENLPRLDWRDLWTKEHKEEWIVEPLIAARRLIALYSPPKTGKSLIMLELAAAIATGRSVLGIEKVTKHRVLYVDFENDPVADTMERLIDMGYGPEDLDDLVMLSFPHLGKLDTERGSLELVAAALFYECDVIIIDTVSRSVQGEENSNDTWLSFYRHTGLKLKKHGIAMVRLDHSGKDVEKGQRGGSAKSGDVDAVWRMTLRSEDLIDFMCEAQRFPIAEKSFTVKRTNEGGRLRHTVLGNPWREKREAVIAKLTGAGVPKDPTLSMRKVIKLVRDAGLPCTNAEMRTEFFKFYCDMPDAWEQLAARAEAEMEDDDE